MIPWLLLLAYLVVLFGCLWKIFQKAGIPAWKGLVPLYNFYVWIKLIGKPWYWIILLLAPGINLLMLIIMNVNLSIVFGEQRLSEHVKMAVLPWLVIPQLAFQEKHVFKGVPPQRKRSFQGQWGDAILFAVIVATAFRTFTFEAFTIPTPSMEKSLLVGDYLFVSKLSYGPRMPMTPITFPFTHHTLPFSASTPSFTDWFSLPYFRLPGFGAPERGDAVVFNFPEGDTVVADMQDQSYYQLVRDLGCDRVWNEQDGYAVKDENGQRKEMHFGHILVRPTDKQENYIKRCVAVAGDTLEVRDGYVWINGVQQELPPMAQYGYETTFNKGARLSAKTAETWKNTYDLTSKDIIWEMNPPNIPLTKERMTEMSKLPMIEHMQQQNHPRGYENPYHKLPYFPNNASFDWSEDNFGPLWIPKQGATIQLTTANLPLYRRAITVYEGNTIEVKGDDILINGAVATSYTFKQDYYWMMGDNRHRSQDSRFWGFVPFDHVVGKAVLVWFTKDPETGIRWKRLFTLVK